MELKQGVFSNTLAQIASRAVVVVVSLITTAVLTRSFGASGYGNYVFITSLILVFVGLSDLGMTTISIREASADKNQSVSVFSQLLNVRLIFSLILFLIFNLLVIALPQFRALRPESFFASFVIIFLVLRTTIEAVLQCRMRFDLSSSLEVFASLFFLLPLVLLPLFGTKISLPALMMIWSFSAIASGVVGVAISSRFFSFSKIFNKEKMLLLLKEAFPLGLYLLVYSVYDRGVDTFVLKTFHSSQEVGYYGLAYKIYGNLILGAAFLMNSLFPLLASLKDLVLVRKLYQKAFFVLLATGLLIMAVCFVGSPFVINLIAGKDFLPASPALKILSLALVISYLNHLTGYLMVAMSGQKKLLFFSLIGFAVNLLLNLLFIPRFSFIAASWVTVATELVLFVLTKNYLKKKYSCSFSFADLISNAQELFIKKQKYFEVGQ